MDPLSQLISNDVARRLDAAQPPLTYGVWISGQGWLKNAAGRVFATQQRAVAESAARLWGAGTVILPFDESLHDLERAILEQQQVSRTRRWTQRLTAFLAYGISRFLFRKQSHA